MREKKYRIFKTIFVSVCFLTFLVVNSGCEKARQILEQLPSIGATPDITAVNPDKGTHLGGTAVTITGGDGSSSFTITATDKIIGIDQHQLDLQVQSTGVYKITPKKGWEYAYPVAFVTTITAGMIAELTTQASSYVTITTKDADTPAVTNSSFAFMLVGMDVENPY